MHNSNDLIASKISVSLLFGADEDAPDPQAAVIHRLVGALQSLISQHPHDTNLKVGKIKWECEPVNTKGYDFSMTIYLGCEDASAGPIPLAVVFQTVKSKFADVIAELAFPDTSIWIGPPLLESKMWSVARSEMEVA